MASSSSSNEGVLKNINGCISKILEKIMEWIGLGIPTAYVSAVHISSIDLTKASFVFDMLVKNPSRISFPIADMSYLVDSAERKLVSGTITDAGTIEAKSSSTIKIPVTLVFQDILSTFTDIKPGSVIPYRMKIEFMVDVPIFGKSTVPVEKTGEIPIPSIPIIILEKIEFKKFSLDECVTALHLKLESKNEFEMGLTALKFELWLSGEKIGSAELAKSAQVEKSGTISIEIPLTFRPSDFGLALWEMMGKLGIDYKLKGSIGVDTTFGSMNMPFSKEGSVSLIKSN